MGNDFWSNLRAEFTPSLRDSDLLKKAACLFAGLGHLQPLLLATTNAHYLLDRFCMERCCSSEYISRIVTSIIFMEILSIIVVRIVLYGALKGPSANWSGAQQLVTHNKEEEKWKDFVSILILLAIFLGYLQILLAFLSGGKKGHMHWFYASLMIQHLLNSLIAGSIGFWEVGRALWYLVALPMAPIVVFFYQLYIHSWIRNNGPRDAEYLVVECQILLALFLSGIATVCWTIGYVIPHIPQISPNNPATLDKLPNPDNTDTEITKTHIITAKEYTYSVPVQSAQSLTISSKSTNSDVTVTIKYVKVTLNGASPLDIKVYPNKTLKVNNSAKTVNVEATGQNNKYDVTIKIAGDPVYKGTVSGANVKISKMYLALEHTASITVSPGQGGSETVKVQGYAYIAKCGHYIKSISGATEMWKEDWEGEKCLYAAYYKNGNASKALLMLHVIGNTLTTKYYGKDTGGTWRKIDANKFNEKLNGMITSGTFSLTNSEGEAANDPRHNTDFGNVLDEGWKWNPLTWTSKEPTPTWLPLIMQGLSVGAVGSIFPNLIPKTLTCPKTSRTLSVMNMFLVTVPHIFNVMLGDMDLLGWIGVGDDWTGPGWHYSLLLYIIYILAILFAIFNIHYPEWALSTFLRNNTWMVFLMILFTDVLNESFNAISRAGICSQKSANDTPNHPCLHNKIACLMNLTYIPFWMTTMDPYVAILVTIL